MLYARMNTKEKIQDFRNKGNTCFKNKKFLEAILCYKKGLQLDENNPHINSNLAQAYLEICDFASAESHSMIAIANNGDSPKGYFRAAKASVGMGDRMKAIKYLKQGIENCHNKSNIEDLRNYLQILSGGDPLCIRFTSRSSQGDISETEDVPSLTSDSDSDESTHNDNRSRSTSRMSGAAVSMGPNKTPITNQRSVSMSRTSAININNKPNKKFRKRSQKEGNPFMSTLESLKKEKGIQQITQEQFWIMQRKELQSLLKEGSEVMASGLSRKAVEKYKTGFDMILDHSLKDFSIKEMDFIVLKYALCVGWIDLANYGDIVKAVEYLKEIEDERASKFPAVFYGLGSAYYKLNRYRVATEHLEKGLLLLKRELKFEVQCWPGTNNIIPETRRRGLEEVLKELLKTCRAYHEPDAICRYSQCLNLSSHIIPSEHIFYSDPDFCGFVIVICQEKCRIEYHLSCWKEYKEAASSNEIGKMSDKDFMGKFCPTTDCVTQTNDRSVITKIEIVGEDTTIKTSIEASKIETTIKESKKAKKKKSEKSSEIVGQDKPKNKPRPKVKKSVAEAIQTSPQIQAAISAEELTKRLEKLKALRNANFGYTDDNHWNPKEKYYGREDVQHLDHFLSPEFSEETEAIRAKKEFVFSYFYEFIRNEGAQKIKEVEQKWLNEVDDFEGVKDFLNSYTNICNFLLQSYCFASIDDYICLAERLPETYDMAKTILVESLSFTLTGLTNITKQSLDMPQLNNDIETVIESQTQDKVSLNATVSSTESKGILTSNSDACQNIENKSADSTMPESSVDKPSSNNGEELIPHVEVDDVVEDPDINTAENIVRVGERYLISVSESEGEKVDLLLSENSCDDIGEVDADDKVENDNGKQQDEIGKNREENEKNQETDIVKNQEEEKKKGKEEELEKSLNPEASEFEHPDHKAKPEGEVESCPITNDQFVDTASGYNNSLDLVPPHNWSLEDGQHKGRAVRRIPPAYSTKVAFTSVGMNPPYIQTFGMPVQKPLNLNSTSSQTDMQNFKEEISTLESTVKKLEKELEFEKNERKTSKKTLESKLEQQDKTIKNLQLEMAVVVLEKNEDIKKLKEQIKKKEEEIEAGKTKCANEKKAKEHTEERMRNLISETGQKVQDSEKELEATKLDLLLYQQQLLTAKKEAGDIKTNVCKQISLDTLQAMKSKVKYLTDSSIPNKTDVTRAIKEWEQHLITITEHEFNLRAHCASLKEKMGKITPAEFVKLEWPDLPREPSCPLDVLEEMTRKALDEREDMKERLRLQYKEMVQLKLDQQKALDNITLMEEQHLKVRRAVANRAEEIQNTLSNTPQPNKTLVKLDEAASKLSTSNLKEEENHKHLTGSDENGLKQKVLNPGSSQNGHSNLFIPTVPVNSSTGVPLYQNAAPNYGHRSPYFYNHPYPISIPAQYGQQQNPAVMPALSSAFQFSGAPAFDKTSTSQKAEPKPVTSSSLTEVSKVFAQGIADKSQPPVPEKKKSPSPASGLTPIELTKSAPTLASFQGRAVPVDGKGFQIPTTTTTVGMTKQKLPQMAKPAETQKSSWQMLLNTSVSSSSSLEPKTTATSAPKPKAGSSSFQKLMAQLFKSFPTKTEQELASIVTTVRERNNNSLSGLTVPNIITMVDKVLKERANKKPGSMGLDKFGGTAWSGVRDSVSDWSKPKDSSEDDCIICMEAMGKDQTSLHCKHSFHTKCIRQWLRTESICPICRLFTRMVDEFPPLS